MNDFEDTFAFSKILNVKVGSDFVLNAYPNPATDRVMISNYGLVKQVIIQNVSGIKIIESQKLSNDGIDVTRLQQGIYTVTITLFDGTVSIQKLLFARH